MQSLTCLLTSSGNRGFLCRCCTHLSFRNNMPTGHGLMESSSVWHEHSRGVSINNMNTGLMGNQRLI